MSNKDKIDNNKEVFDNMNKHFASASAVVGTTSSSAGSMAVSRLKDMLKDPARNASQIASLSGELRKVNGIYGNVIRYFGSILTFDHLIHPVVDNPEEMSPEGMQESFAQSAIFLDRFNPKFHLPQFLDKMMTQGVVYLYKLEDSKGIAFQEIPMDLCRISYVENGVYRYQLDITKINDTTIESYPKEVERAYNSYSSGNTSKLIDDRWYEVSNKGVAFSMDAGVLSQGGYSLPPLADSLLDILRVENAKDEMEDVSELDNSRIVHSQVPTDEKGRPLMEHPVVREYHEMLKRVLPKGAVAITNPFKTNGLPLNGVGNEGKFTLLDKSIENLYDGAGVSKLLFAGDGTSSRALDRSIDVHTQWLYSTVLPMFTNYFNDELKTASKKGTLWKVKFLLSSYFKKDEAIKTAKDQLSYGGSRMEYLASTGMSPLEVANMLIFEQRVLNIDEYMIAKETSYTKSGKDEGEESSGSPESDDPSDDTIRIRDAE